VYATFAEASRAAPPTKPVGYDHPEPATYYRGRLDRIHHDDYPAIFWFRVALEGSESLFEIGGHVGVAFYSFARLVTYPPNLKWTILEVPAVAASGEALCSERGRTNLRFITDPSQTKGADIVLAAGSLQYVESPSLAEAIAGFRLRPRHVIVNKTPMYDGIPFVTLQNIGGAYCPYRIPNRADFVASLEHLGYELHDTWQKERLFRITGHPDKAFDHYSGFYFRLR
jgi:putative methyltransferase (TIGR04325 family)